MDFSTGSEVPTDDTATAVRTSKTVDARAFEVTTEEFARRPADRFRQGHAERPLPAAGRELPGHVRPRRLRLCRRCRARPAHLRLHLASCGSCRRRRCCPTAAPSRGLPISCFLNAVRRQPRRHRRPLERERLAGVAGRRHRHLLGQPALDRREGRPNGKTSGIIPFIRVMDSLTLAISPGLAAPRLGGGLSRRSTIPEIEEFLEIRRPTGGDSNRKALNLHHGMLDHRRVHARGRDGDEFGAALARRTARCAQGRRPRAVDPAS